MGLQTGTTVWGGASNWDYSLGWANAAVYDKMPDDTITQEGKARCQADTSFYFFCPSRALPDVTVAVFVTQ